MTQLTLDPPHRTSQRQTSPNQAGIRARTLELLRTEIDFIPNGCFRKADHELADIVETTLRQAADASSTVSEMPGQLRPLCQVALLTHQQEIAFFREMNYLKFQAYTVRAKLDPDQPDPQAIETIETLLAKAGVIRNHIVQANVRLVISIVKKLVTPQASFDDLLSDGIFTLMNAVDKFDFDRGFRFSTYAYRSVARHAYRTIANLRKEAARYVPEMQESHFPEADGSSASHLTDQIWSDLREKAYAMLQDLDRREQFIIRSRFALGAHRKVRTLQYLANKLGVSKERARQIEKRAIGKLCDMAQELQVDDLAMAALA